MERMEGPISTRREGIHDHKASTLEVLLADKLLQGQR